jgi:hypothetical protein
MERRAGGILLRQMWSNFKPSGARGRASRSGVIRASASTDLANQPKKEAERLGKPSGLWVGYRGGREGPNDTRQNIDEVPRDANP